MKKLRESGWSITKNGRDRDSNEKRGWIRQVVQQEYPNSDPASHTVYVSNFLHFLRMEDEEFRVLNRVSITHARSSK